MPMFRNWDNRLRRFSQSTKKTASNLKKSMKPLEPMKNRILWKNSINTIIKESKTSKNMFNLSQKTPALNFPQDSNLRINLFSGINSVLFKQKTQAKHQTKIFSLTQRIIFPKKSSIASCLRWRETKCKGSPIPTTSTSSYRKGWI
jgi:hypothetical protein